MTMSSCVWPADLPPLPDLHLHSDSLFWKHGFSDGDMPEAYQNRWMYCADGYHQGAYPFDEWDWRLVLITVIKAHLLPAIEAAGNNITTRQFQPHGWTNHNPIWIETIEGVEWIEDFATNNVPMPTVEVAVPADAVLRAHLMIKGHRP